MLRCEPVSVAKGGTYETSETQNICERGPHRMRDTDPTFGQLGREITDDVRADYGGAPGPPV